MEGANKSTELWLRPYLSNVSSLNIQVCSDGFNVRNLSTAERTLRLTGQTTFQRFLVSLKLGSGEAKKASTNGSCDAEKNVVVGVGTIKNYL